MKGGDKMASDVRIKDKAQELTSLLKEWLEVFKDDIIRKDSKNPLTEAGIIYRRVSDYLSDSLEKRKKQIGS